MTDTMTLPRRGRGRPRGGEATTQATRASLLDAAYASFAENGFNGTSMREVARMCGVSHATLLHHFQGKADLLISVLHKRDSLHGINPQDPPPLEELLVDLVAGARKNQEQEGLVRLLTVIAAESASPEHPAHAYIVNRHREFTRYVAIAIRRAQSDGSIAATGDPEQLAVMIVSLWDGLQLNQPYNAALNVPDTLQLVCEAVVGHALAV